METNLIDNITRYRFKNHVIILHEDTWYIYEIIKYRDPSWAIWKKKNKEKYMLKGPKGYRSLNKAIQILIKP